MGFGSKPMLTIIWVYGMRKRLTIKKLLNALPTALIS